MALNSPIKIPLLYTTFTVNEYMTITVYNGNAYILILNLNLLILIFLKAINTLMNILK